MKDLKHVKMRNEKPLLFKMLPMMVGLFCLLTLSQTSMAQATLTSAEVQLQVDRDYVDDHVAQIEMEMDAVRNDNQLDADEKTVRLKLLYQGVELLEQGVLIEDAWDIAYRILVDRIQSGFPDMPLKTFVTEYKDQFS
jgi:hypothetical protein